MKNQVRIENTRSHFYHSCKYCQGQSAHVWETKVKPSLPSKGIARPEGQEGLKQYSDGPDTQTQKYRHWGSKSKSVRGKSGWPLRSLGCYECLEINRYRNTVWPGGSGKVTLSWLWNAPFSSILTFPQPLTEQSWKADSVYPSLLSVSLKGKKKKSGF